MNPTDNSTDARRRAEKSFKPDHAPNARKAMPSYEAEAVAVREKTARLKALRLAKQDHDGAAVPGDQCLEQSAPRRPRQKSDGDQTRMNTLRRYKKRARVTAKTAPRT